MSTGALALRGGYFGQGNGYTAVSDVRCDPAWDMTLLECCSRECRSNSLRERKFCDRDRDSVGVRCMDAQRLNNIGTIIMSTTGSSHHIILITWRLDQNNTGRAIDEPRSFEVRCFNEWHSIKVSLSNTTFTTQVGGLLPSSSYTCCVSAVYDSYVAKGVCTQTELPCLELPYVTAEIEAANSKLMNVLVFGALGSIIIFFLVLSALLCVALIYQVRKRSKESVPVMPTR